MLLDTWQSIGVLSFPEPKAARSTALPYLCNQRILKVATRAVATAGTKIKPSWHRAGYLDQWIGTQLISSRSIALNQETVLILPLLRPYRLTFKPVAWLPNLRVYFYRYNSEESPELLEEALRMR